ncbi:hypothetical protein [Olivibacter sitiensis]|uniref:hypothetical protein n=1 Tax=Olivibacter sitiensis TaxID=376470 RepID=UPI000486401D|nr:hypothetical protein [Olivibacter sitiensis]
MALKSSWAYQNGNRTLHIVKENLKDKKTGWIEKNGMELYAERYEPTGKLMVKTFPNKKIADAAALRVGGKRSMSWPFTIIKTEV